MKRKIFKRLMTLTVIAVLMVAAVFAGFAGVLFRDSADHAADQNGAYSNCGSVGSLLAVSNEDGGVYDNKDKRLYYDVRDGTVFNSDGEITYSESAGPVYYNPETKEFHGNPQDVLEVYDRPSSRGGKYLGRGSYKVGSTAITETFYKLPLRTAGSEVLATVTSYPEVTSWFLGIKDWLPLNVRVTFVVKNTLGKVLNAIELADECAPFFKSYNYNGFSVISPVVDLFTSSQLKSVISLRDKYPKDKLFNWLNEIELLNPDAERLDLKDDRDKLINVVDGQLFDYFDFPLIGKDYKPLFYDGNHYFGIDGRLLTASGGYLWDGGKKVHSVIKELEDGKYLFFLFMKDGVTLCPLYGEPDIKADGSWAETYSFCYLDWTPIDEKDFTIPKISKEDTYIKYPELDPNNNTDDWWNKFWRSLSGFFSNLVKNSGNALIIAAIVILLLLTSGIWFPLLLKILPLIIKGIVFVVLLPFKLVGAIFKAVGGLFKGKSKG